MISRAVLFALVALLLTPDAVGARRVPAEWEPQAGTWLQWPGPWEASYERAFAEMSAVIVRYQPLHVLYANDEIRRRAEAALRDAGADPASPQVHWHAIENDSAWMRDNGPVYVIEDGALTIQDWGFDAWGGGFGEDIPFAADDRVPVRIGELLSLPVRPVDIVHERGNLEFNGADAVLLNWSTIGDPARNPDYTRERAKRDLQRAFGVERVVFVEGVPEGDRTRGHVDGFARFISEDTAVVAQCTARSKCRPDSADGLIYENAARALAEAGFEVVRDPIEARVEYEGQAFDTVYMNWLVGNGFVISVGFGDPAADAAAQARIEGYFPGRDVYLIEMLDSWYHGGGVHCHTNDQPAL